MTQTKVSSTVIIVNISELYNKPDFENEAQSFCVRIVHSTDTVSFFPRSGYLMPLVALLSERKISYKVEFAKK